MRVSEVFPETKAVHDPRLAPNDSLAEPQSRMCMLLKNLSGEEITTKDR